MITTTWNIIQTDYLVADGFITTAHWTANAVDGTYTASVYSTCGFAAATPSIPYASVTMQEVLDWCWANGVDKAAIESNLAAQIALLKNPVSAAGIPWSA
ncbi:hypothetical protein MUP38_08200 [Candidatus Bathyarchaeota archaeon]|nr:hypothetical protein [Candidatus Bathyarchaeota archaeon]